MVSISEPPHCTVSTVQDLTDMPSRSTVQAPQCEVSQPMCGPVCASLSRSVWISSSRASTLTSTPLPFSLNATLCSVAIACSFVFLIYFARACADSSARRVISPHIAVL